MAPLNFSLQDYTTWTAADTLASQQLAWVRARIHATIPGVTYGSLWAAANGTTSSNIVVNSGWLQKVRARQQHAGLVDKMLWLLQAGAWRAEGR
jgi:hypothetical protein